MRAIKCPMARIQTVSGLNMSVSCSTDPVPGRSSPDASAGAARRPLRSEFGPAASDRTAPSSSTSLGGSGTKPAERQSPNVTQQTVDLRKPEVGTFIGSASRRLKVRWRNHILTLNRKYCWTDTNLSFTLKWKDDPVVVFPKDWEAEYQTTGSTSEMQPQPKGVLSYANVSLTELILRRKL